MKRKLFMMIAGVMALLLPACGAKEDERNGAVVVEGITSDESDFDGNGYQKIYGRIVSETEEGADTFSLIYLDRDDVPELVVYDTAYGTYSIYTVKDGNAFVWWIPWLRWRCHTLKRPASWRSLPDGTGAAMKGIWLLLLSGKQGADPCGRRRAAMPLPL